MSNLQQAVEQAQDALANFFEEASRSLEKGGEENLLRTLIYSDELKSSAKEGFDSVHEIVADSLEPSKEAILVDGVFCEVSKASPKKSWNHPKAKDDVAKRVSDMTIDFDTGEVVLTTFQAVRQALDICGTSYWKVKQMNNIGLDANSYCEVGEPRKRVQLRRDTA